MKDPIGGPCKEFPLKDPPTGPHEEHPFKTISSPGASTFF